MQGVCVSIVFKFTGIKYGRISTAFKNERIFYFVRGWDLNPLKINLII